jgi:membrane fusion protein, multidrug efflux system
MSRKRMLGLSVVIIAAVLAAGCTKKNTAEETLETQGIPVFTAAVKTGSISDKIRLVGTLMPYEQVNVYSKASGKITKYAVEEGASVNEGDIIAYVDRDEPGFEFTPAPVKSPAKGIVIKKFIDAGTTVTPATGGAAMATPVVSVGDISKLKAVVYVVEEDIARVKIGQEADITLDAYPGEMFRGNISAVSPSADSLSHSSKVEVVVDNPDNKIKAGLSADVSVITGTMSGVLVIPRDSVIRKTNELYVFIIRNGLAEKRAISIGFDDGEYVQVKKGLSAGEKVAASDYNVLQEGLKVKDSGELKAR